MKIGFPTGLPVDENRVIYISNKWLGTITDGIFVTLAVIFIANCIIVTWTKLFDSC